MKSSSYIMETAQIIEPIQEKSTTKHIDLHNKITIPMDIPSTQNTQDTHDIIVNISDVFRKLCGPFNSSLDIYLDSLCNGCDGDTDSDSDSSVDSEPDILDIFEEEDYIQTGFLIHDMIEYYIEDHIVEQSSPSFIETMCECITNSLLDLWEDYGFSIEETSETELKTWIHREIHEFIDCFLWPPRQGRGIVYKEMGDSSFTIIREKLEKLTNVELAEQRSQEWYNQRNNLLTASNIWKVFASQAQYNSLVVEKCKPVDQGAESAMRSVSSSSSLNWGIMFEPITAEIYCMKNRTKLGEFGCIVHPEYPFIGASPDGINIDESSPLYGRMVEIKNVVSRQITGIPLESYWIQMQLQMEICDLDECDFIETKFAKISREEYYGGGGGGDVVVSENGDTSPDIIRGIILHVGPRIFIPMLSQRNISDVDVEYTDENIKKVVYADTQQSQQQQQQPFYVYIPLDISRENVDSWIQEYKTNNPNLVVMETIYWKLEQYSCVFVHRNREWFLAALPKIKECWDTIEYDRVHGYQHRLSSKKKTTEVIHTDTTCSVQMPAKSSVCLVKLDYM